MRQRLDTQRKVIILTSISIFRYVSYTHHLSECFSSQEKRTRKQAQMIQNLPDLPQIIHGLLFKWSHTKALAVHSPDQWNPGAYRTLPSIHLCRPVHIYLIRLVLSPFCRHLFNDCLTNFRSLQMLSFICVFLVLNDAYCIIIFYLYLLNSLLLTMFLVAPFHSTENAMKGFLKLES